MKSVQMEEKFGSLRKSAVIGFANTVFLGTYVVWLTFWLTML